MSQSLARTFTPKQLLLFALPSIIMMMFLSLYTIVDGFFVARFVGADALSAVNITYPIISLFFAVGVMFSTGGSAVVSKLMGEGNIEEARSSFSFLTISALVLSLVIQISSLVFLDEIVSFLGADEALFSMCVDYIRILLLFAPFSVLQTVFQSFFVAAGKPRLGLILTISAGLINMILDYVFIVPLQMGITGAAWATICGYFLPSIGGLFFFFSKKETLHFGRPVFRLRQLLQAMSNGSSEMVTNLSTSVTTLLFNLLMMYLVGSHGVAAITAVLYSQFLLTALFLGFSIGVAPIISFHFGAKHWGYLLKLQRTCFLFVAATSLLMFAAAFFGAELLAVAFAKDEPEVYAFIVRGMRLFSLSFLLVGINIFSSAFFTALSDGKTSAAISFGRTFLFILLGMALLVPPLQVDGVWLSIPFAELATLFVSFLFVRKNTRLLHQREVE